MDNIPIVNATGSKIYLTWKNDGIKMTVRKISDKSSTGLRGEVLIEYLPEIVAEVGLGTHIIQRTINLTAQRGQRVREIINIFF